MIIIIYNCVVVVVVVVYSGNELDRENTHRCNGGRIQMQSEKLK